jgi:hypothetical protein
MHSLTRLAIAQDNVGGTDPETLMTVCLWIAKAFHFAAMFI